MPTSYEKAQDDVMRIVAKVMKKWHPDLHKEGVTVDVLMAYNSEDAAVKWHGYPAAALIKKVGLRQRVLGRADVEIIIDDAMWADFTPKQRDALIDHELCHMQITLDKYGKCKRDSADRPKLKTRLHDLELGTFDQVVRRHGEDALDAQVLRNAAKRYEQLMFQFANPDAVPAEEDDST